ncbi:GumC family protein [Mucilaginibacter conchicola]|nr:tyrosine-protein kinase [Mucilaginibacter conchicola]
MNDRDILAQKLDFTYKKQDDVGEVRQLIAIVVNYWYLFVGGLILSIIIAFFVIQYTPKQWNVMGKIIIEDEKNSPSKLLTNGVSSDLSSLFDIKSNSYNEVRVLESRNLLRRVITEMNINVHVYDMNGLLKKELYDNSPFKIVLSHNEELNRSSNYKVTVINNQTYHLVDDDNDIDLNGSFGVPVKLPDYSITLIKTPGFKPEGDYRIAVRSIKRAENELAAKFGASLSDKQSTVIDVQLNYGNSKRGELILQKFMELYLKNNLSNKVRMADSTIKFIDSRLTVVSAELGKVEKNLETYKVNNKISDINAQSKALVQGASDYQQKLNETEVQLAVVNDLYKYVSNERNAQVVPSSLITKDMSFGSAINAYNEMLLRREQLQLNLQESSSVIKNLDQQIETARKMLLTSLKSYRHSLNISQSAIVRQNAAIGSKIADAPVKERVYLDYSRQQSLKQDLYLFLLQKREETAISQKATISNCRILDNAESDEAPFAPKKSFIYTIASLLGLFAPAAGLGLKQIMNNRISKKDDIEKHTTVAVLGQISKNTHKQKMLIYNEARTVISEEIRALRTNLKYITDGGKSNVIMFTSSMSGEGKSFISLNLGNSIALSGKKVVLLELDLRKPKLLKYLGTQANYGFTDYVISPDRDCIDDLIHPSNFNENFYFISSGTIPPNPAEMLMSPRLKELIEELRVKFDYVIIDTAPVGQVSDALVIEEFADVTCYVMRQNYTYKSQLNIVNDLQKYRKVKQLYLVVNDIELNTNGITGYGYGYGNYNNYQEIEETYGSKLSTLMRKFRPSVK